MVVKFEVKVIRHMAVPTGQEYFVSNTAVPLERSVKSLVKRWQSTFERSFPRNLTTFMDSSRAMTVPSATLNPGEAILLVERLRH